MRVCIFGTSRSLGCWMVTYQFIGCIPEGVYEGFGGGGRGHPDDDCDDARGDSTVDKFVIL